MVRVRIGGDEQELTWEEWESRIRAGRIPLDALVRIEAVTGSEWVVAGDLEIVRGLRDERALDWRSRFLAGQPPLLTALLVGVQIRLWWWAWHLDLLGIVAIAFLPSSMPAVLEDGQVWRPLTMGLAHTSVDHLALNMMWLAYTGWNIERALGRANLATLFFASVLAGSVFSMFGSPLTESHGASGGVFGLIAASVVFGLKHPDLLPARGRQLYGFAMLPYLVVMFWSGLTNESTDNWSHFGGLVCGGLLGMCLDPVGFERRVGWNRGVQVATAVVAIATLVVLGGFGPRLVPLGPPDEVRAAGLGRPVPDRPGAADAAEPVSFAVPWSWRPGTDRQRRPAFVSPAHAGTTRAFGVRVEDHDRLMTGEALVEGFTTRVKERSPEVVIGAAEPAVVAGRPGVAVVATFDVDGRPVRLEWRAATWGVWALEEVWQVEADRADRLAPLAERLRRRVAWTEPLDLREARAAVEATPQSGIARGRLAVSLARAGEVEEAMALHDALVAEAPDDLARRIARLDSVALVQPADAEVRWAAALEETPEPEVIVAVVAGLEAADRTEEARGLLRVAWDRTPGDVKLRRARRARDLPVALDPATGVPWDLAFVPATAERRSPEEMAERTSRPLDLDSAKASGVELERERRATVDAAVAAVRASDPAGLVPLLVLKEGFVPDKGDFLEGLEEDLEGVADGVTPSWMPAELADVLRSHPGYRSVLAAAPSR